MITSEMQPANSHRPYRLLFWLNGAPVVLMGIMLLFGELGMLLLLFWGWIIIVAVLLVNVLLLIYTLFTMIRQALRRRIPQEVAYSRWQVAFGYLLAVILWGLLLWWLSTIHFEKWW